MTDKFRDSKAVVIAAGLASAVAGYCFVVFALPLFFPTILTRQLNQSSQEVASFLQKARTQSVERGAPVACRVEKRGSRTVLWLDWNVTKRPLRVKGDSLELPRGLILSQDGEPQTSGVIAVFNPRGGFQLGYNSSASSKALALSVSRPSRPSDGLREVSMTGSGDFLATNTQDVPPQQMTASLAGR